ncbi:MAG: hypothetical protein HGA78_06310, partial [Nitrospirales bacterium]|nr:hypothetical protein [Nitrospirales bacterium]
MIIVIFFFPHNYYKEMLHMLTANSLPSADSLPCGICHAPKSPHYESRNMVYCDRCHSFEKQDDHKTEKLAEVATGGEAQNAAEDHKYIYQDTLRYRAHALLEFIALAIGVVAALPIIFGVFLAIKTICRLKAWQYEWSFSFPPLLKEQSSLSAEELIKFKDKLVSKEVLLGELTLALRDRLGRASLMSLELLIGAEILG